MEFKAQRRKLRVTVDSEVYEVIFPRLHHLEDFEKKREKLEKPLDQLNALVHFLNGLGLPEKVCRSLEMEDLEAIVDLLSGKKKAK